jgi:hypothetical protein
LDFPNGLFVLVTVMGFLFNKPDRYSRPSFSRRDCLRYMMCGWGLMLARPFAPIRAAGVGSDPGLLEKYLGEELRYQVGYGLLDHVGDAKTGFMPTDVSDIYKISLEGHGVGFINFLLGGVTYTYTSFCRYLSDQDRLHPVYFELKKQRGTTQSLRSIRYNYKTREIIYQQTTPAGKALITKESMATDRIYEDYLTLFYNFRHGLYGSLVRNRPYKLPLYVKAQMQPVMLHIADIETEDRFRRRERNQTGKDYFIRFQINPEDVSSGSGEIKGWLSSDATPVKGTIEDVVFFGDLWGDLIEKQIVSPRQPVSLPAEVQDLF